MKMFWTAVAEFVSLIALLGSIMFVGFLYYDTTSKKKHWHGRLKRHARTRANSNHRCRTQSHARSDWRGRGDDRCQTITTSHCQGIWPTPEKDFPVEYQVRRPNDDDLVVVLVTKKSLVNLISDAMKLMREFEAQEEREKENDE